MYKIILGLCISFALCAQDQKMAVTAQAIAPLTQKSVLNVVTDTTDIQNIIKAYCLEWETFFDAQAFPGYKPIQALFSSDNKQIAILLQKVNEPHIYHLKFYDLIQQKFRLFDNQLDYINIPITYASDEHRIEFSHDEKYLIVKEPGCLHMFDTITGKEYFKQPAVFYTYAHSFDGKYLVTAKLERLCIYSFEQDNDAIIKIDIAHCIIFSPDNKYIATANAMKNTIDVYDVSLNQLIKSITIEESDSSLHSHSFTFSPDSQNIITSTNKGSNSQITIWNISNNMKKTASLPIGSYILVAHPKKNLLAIADNKSNKIILWNLDTNTIDMQWFKLGAAFSKYALYSLRFSADGKHIIMAGGELIIAEIETGEIVTRINLRLDKPVAVSSNQQYIALMQPHFQILKAKTI